MARKPKAETSKSLITWQGASIGSVLSILWVVITATFFVQILNRSGKAFDEVLPTVIWPAVVVALGVPLIIFLWFGGSSVVMGLVRLREHLSKLDEYVSSFDEMESKSSEIRQNLDGASATVTAAANTLSANLEKFDQDVRPAIESQLSAMSNQNGCATAPVAEEDPALLEKKRSFGRLIQSADTIFYEALTQRNKNPGRGKRRIVVAPGGSDKYEISRQLGEEGILSTEESATLTQIYTLDMMTRPTGRRSLVEAEVAALEARIVQLNRLRAAKTAKTTGVTPETE